MPKIIMGIIFLLKKNKFNTHKKAVISFKTSFDSMLELTWRGTEHLQRRAQIYFSEKK